MLRLGILQKYIKFSQINRNFSNFNKINLQKNKLFENICKYNIQLKRNSGAYEGDGKTTVQILNKELDLGLMINSYSQYGFRLNNEMVIIGPMAIFPRSVLSWNISSCDDITEESLSLFNIIEPKLDVLIIGVGDQQITPKFSMKIINYMKKHNINVEVLRTEQACPIFNFLNAEGRVVAAAMIPPHHIHLNEDDLMRSQIRQNNLYAIDNK